MDRVIALMREYNGDDENVDVLRQYFEAFDDLFFFGSLKANTSVGFTADIGGALGVTMPDGGYREIRIEILDQAQAGVFFADRLPGERSLRHYARILLHEMTHAVLMLYSCHLCGPCRELLFSARGAGRAGHGECWQLAGYSVEFAISQTVLTHLDMQITQSSYNDDPNIWAETFDRASRRA